MMLSNDKQLMDMERIKSFYFDLLTSNSEAETFPKLVKDLITGLKQITKAESVSLFLFNKWKERYILEQSTVEGNLVNKVTVSLDEWEKISQNIDIEGKAYFNISEMSESGEVAYIVMIKKTTASKEVMGWFEFKVDHINVQNKLFLAFEAISKESIKLVELWKRFFGSLDEDARYEQLYRVTSKFHSSMDMDDVLGEVISTLKEVYPSFEYYLLLSHDNSNHQGLPIKDLEYGTDNGNVTATQAYLTGNVQFEDSLVDERSVLYTPLKGKQGVYGVLQVIAPNSLVFPKQEVGFIELLANTAGSALENAQLYQQSRRLISDLQLINKTSHRLNSNLRLNETITFMCEQIMKSFKSEEVGFIIFEPSEQFKVLPGSSDFFCSTVANGFLHSINERIKAEEDAFFIGDLNTDTMIKKEHFRSLMAVPMIQTGCLKGAVYVLHQKPYHFTFENFKLLQSLIHHSTLAVTNSMLREELEKLVITDHLTKLYSRNYLDERIQYSMQAEQSGTFLLIDIDNFKSVNDTYGHQVGDEVIIQVANIIKENIKDIDIGARWGGEELAVYLPKVDLEAGVDVAKCLVKTVESSTNPNITISCGVAYWHKDENDSVKNLFNRADEALYKAKELGKNRVVIYGT